VFARKVEQAGIAFVGPTPEVIDSLGDKTKARTLGNSSGANPYADDPLTDRT
jgi:pyruvate carboxylase